NLHASYLNLPVADSTTSIAENFPQGEMNPEVFPNPASDILKIILANAPARRLELYDTSGKIIAAVNEPKQITSMDVRNLSTGIYFLKSYFENSNAVRKIVIMRK